LQIGSKEHRYLEVRKKRYIGANHFQRKKKRSFEDGRSGEYFLLERIEKSSGDPPAREGGKKSGS